MSKLIDNIKRLAGMVKNETKSGGNTAVRVGGLFEEMAAELENKYDKTESDQLMSRHNTADDSHLNIQERIDTALGDLNRNKLDKTGNGSDVTVHFNEAAERRNVSSGDTLSVLLGKVQKWFAGLQAVAFSGKAADLAEDTTHRFLMDTERTKLNGIETGANKYIHPTAHPATMITDDAAHRFVSDTEKNAWNGKAAGTHTHPATQVTEDATHRFLTDAERTKLNEIETGANKYTHPTTHPATLIMQDTTHRFVTDTEKSGWNSKAAGNHTHNYAAASHTHPATQVTEDTTHRFVSDTDKTNWNSKAAGNHNHNGTYAPVLHNHTADQISDTATKVMMTASERSKLAGIETGIRGAYKIIVENKQYKILYSKGAHLSVFNYAQACFITIAQPKQYAYFITPYSEDVITFYLAYAQDSGVGVFFENKNQEYIIVPFDLVII